MDNTKIPEVHTDQFGFLGDNYPYGLMDAAAHYLEFDSATQERFRF